MTPNLHESEREYLTKIDEQITYAMIRDAVMARGNWVEWVVGCGLLIIAFVLIVLIPGS